MSAEVIALLKRKRAILRARDDLVDFLRYTRPVPDAPDDVEQSLYEPARHHRAVAAALERVAAGTLTRLIITLPPRHGKTTLASHGFPAWFMGRCPNKSMILATYNEKFSFDFGRAVRDIMLSPQYAQVFPGTRLKDDAQSVDRLEIEGGGAVFFAGRGSSVTGRGGDILLLDDPIKDRREADSPTIRNQCWDWFKQVLGTRLMTQGGAIIIIMTRWHEDDIVGRLTDENNPYFNAEDAKDWQTIDLPALANDNDLLGRAPGEALWPERFSASYLLVQKRSDPRGFQALYQGNPTPIDGAFFKADHITTYLRMSDMPPVETMRFYGASDHAVSLAQDRDKTCCLIAGVDQNDDIWIMPDIFWQRASTDQVVEAMLLMMERYKPQFWWAEKGHISKSIGPFLRKRMIEKQIYCAMDEIVPIADKQTRAQAIQARMAMGKVKLPQFTRWYGEAQDQILKFPQGVHDDLIDALAYIGLGLAKQAPRRARREPAQGVRPLTLGWVKQQSSKQARELAYAKARRGW